MLFPMHIREIVIFDNQFNVTMFLNSKLRIQFVVIVTEEQTHGSFMGNPF